MEIVQELEWREIPGWPGYRVNNMGEVQSCKNGNQGIVPGFWRTIKARPNRAGYLYVNPSHEGKSKNLPVHQVVLLAFGFERPDGAEVRHKNGNRADNRLENLAWATHVENEMDKLEHGTRCYGDSHGGAKLNSDKVKTILEQIGAGFSFRQIAREIGISEATIQLIAYGKIWKSLSVSGLSDRLEMFRKRKEHTFVTAFGERKTILQWSRDPRCKTTHGGLRFRLARGMDPETAIVTPAYAV